MKKYIIIAFLTLVAFSCTNDLEKLNINKKDFAVTTDASLFTSAQYKLFNQMTSTSVNENIFRLIMQNWTETTYTDEANYDIKGRNIDEYHWNTLYKAVLKNFEESKGLVSGLADVQTNKIATIELYEIYTYYILVTSFGDIPYTEALDINNLSPVFDNQKTIFNDLLDRLDNNVISKFITDKAGFSASVDIVYQGDINKWKKFANSLKLQMGMVLADADPVKAKKVVNEAIAAGVFTSANDNMKIAFEGAAPYTNPVYKDLVLSGRNDYVPTNTIVDIMNSLNDPRRNDYFTLYQDAYKGGISGELNTFGKFSHVSDKIAKDPKLEAPLMTYFEVEFLLAEALERGFTTTGTAETHYNNAITASIKYWGGTDAEAETYLGETNVAYNTATGDYKQKIGTQKWLALYNRGVESWTEWRRLDYPLLTAPKDAKTTNNQPPYRLTYPNAELTLNGANLKAAGANIGGDKLETKLFWDKN
ncbi:MAG: SusD/RagB family nutrient-binding outer membrane lipoprotein [Polaribacter sp.]